MELYLIWLSLVFESNYILLQQFLKNYPVSENFISLSDINNNLPEKIGLRFSSDELKEQAKKELEFCQKNNIHLTYFLSQEYPFNLQNIPSPPPILFYKGSILTKDEISISVIGSRNYTPYGKAVTQKMAYELSSAGITVISGMARGIDSFSHQSAISSGGRTIAVLGTGIDVIYPSENKKLYQQIIESGAVISEFPLHTAPIAKNFPIRNRIVAGLSLGTLVIEAAKRSGTLITARLAAECGREVYAVPGNIYTPFSEGTNELIKDGAKIVTSVQDIISDLGEYIKQLLPIKKEDIKENPLHLTPIENRVYRLLSLTPKPLDLILHETQIPAKELLPLLSNMELSGYVTRLSGNNYIKGTI